MTCEEFRTSDGNPLTRAKQAAIIKHFLNCKKCQRFATKKYQDEPLSEAEMERMDTIFRENLKDPEFRETLL